jgi:hypothetical protein
MRGFYSRKGMTATVFWLLFSKHVELGTINFSIGGFQRAREGKCSQPVATSTVKQCLTMRRRASDTEPFARSVDRSSGASRMDVRLVFAETTVLS